MSLSLTPRVPILGRNLFNHAKRVGVAFLGTVTTVVLVALDCRCLCLELFDVIILLDENERVNPRRRDFVDVDEDRERTLWQDGVCKTEKHGHVTEVSKDPSRLSGHQYICTSNMIGDPEVALFINLLIRFCMAVITSSHCEDING